MNRSLAFSMFSPDPPPARPELLAPAGDRRCAQAAVENGADAIYFGLTAGFNARARATNFSLADLPELMAFLHRRGVKGYVTLNTLAFPDELPQLEEHVRELTAAGIDAVLVQDLGLVRLIRAVSPELSIHASTQMTLTSSQSLAVAQALGVDRAVLARELSLKEIRRIRAESTLPVEVFVHGALCVAYSGQCLTSESLGGRSANRGQCAQACRMPYELVCDGRDVDLGDQKYLLSPQDLAVYDLVPELIALGVCSFKIEGRLKTPEYVANITRHYRQAIDSALAGRPVEFTPRAVEEMELSFSRGFSPGWMRGCDHKRLVPATSSAKRGVLIGRVTSIGKGRVQIELAGRIKPGDGVVFEGDRAAGQEQGGRVYEVFVRGRKLTGAAEGGAVELAFGRDALDLDQLRAGLKIWKTDDPELTARLRKTFAGPDLLRKIPVDLRVQAAVGRRLVIEARAATGHYCRIESPEPLAVAVRHPLSAEVLRQQFARLGGTAYKLRELEARLDGQPMAPLSVLGKLRHQLVEQLDALSTAISPRPLAAPGVLARLREEIPGSSRAAATDESASAESAPPVLWVLCRSLAQLRAALEAGVRHAYVDFQDIREYRPAVAAARSAEAEIFLATPRIQKPDEAGIFRVLLRHGADGILVRNLGGLAYFADRGVPLAADFSLNATNELTAQYLRDAGAQRITASYDLNRDQLLDLVSAVPAPWLEVVVHQHMPMFHMEHCVFCAVLSPGTNKTNCGRPCDRHQVLLRDHIGMQHPLKADVGCRNTLFNAVPQSGAEVVPVLLARGLRQFRIELLDDAGDELHQTLDLYRQLLAGQIRGRDVWSRLQAANRVGVTRGTLEERRNPLAIL